VPPAVHSDCCRVFAPIRVLIATEDTVCSLTRQETATAFARRVSHSRSLNSAAICYVRKGDRFRAVHQWQHVILLSYPGGIAPIKSTIDNSNVIEVQSLGKNQASLYRYWRAKVVSRLFGHDSVSMNARTTLTRQVLTNHVPPLHSANYNQSKIVLQVVAILISLEQDETFSS
jgi:hypothetical protein